MHNLLEMGVKKSRGLTEKWVLSHLIVFHVRSRSTEFPSNTRAGFLSADVGKTIDCVLKSHLLYCNKTHFCCKFWIHSLDVKPFYWFKLDDDYVTQNGI